MSVLLYIQGYDDIPKEIQAGADVKKVTSNFPSFFLSTV